MFYFGGLRGSHADMVAFSTDLLHWEQCATPLYYCRRASRGAGPGACAQGLSVVYDDSRDTVVMRPDQKVEALQRDTSSLYRKGSLLKFRRELTPLPARM